MSEETGGSGATQPAAEPEERDAPLERRREAEAMTAPGYADPDDARESVDLDESRRSAPHGAPVPPDPNRGAPVPLEPDE